MTVYQGTSFTPELTAAGYALFRAGIKVSAGTCDDLAGSLQRRHQRNGTRWRLLVPAGAGGAGDRVPAHEPDLRGAGRGVRGLPGDVLAGRRGGDQRAGGPGRRISLRDVARLAVKMGWDYLIVDGVHVPAVTFGRKQEASGPFIPASTSGTG